MIPSKKWPKRPKEVKNEQKVLNLKSIGEEALAQIEIIRKRDIAQGKNRIKKNKRIIRRITNIPRNLSGSLAFLGVLKENRCKTTLQTKHQVHSQY